MFTNLRDTDNPSYPSVFVVVLPHESVHDVTPHSDLALQTVPGEIEVTLAPSSPSSYKVGSLDDVGEPALSFWDVLGPHIKHTSQLVPSL